MSQALLDRLTFGASPLDLEAFNALGLDDWLEDQFNPSAQDSKFDHALSSCVMKISYEGTADYAAVNENRPLSLLNKSTAELWHLTEGQTKMAYEERMRPLRELTAVRLLHAAHSKWQLKEMMVDFWLDHFNVHAADAQVAVAMPSFENECIRRHGLGNFQQLLASVAQSTPMLIYLNNRSSRTGAPNENYARELFELHTLGKAHYLNDLYSKWRQVPGAEKGEPKGYIDQDVYEAARAFTGWALEDGRNMGSGLNLPKTGKFSYLESWHDPYQKRILAQDFDPFAPPLADGQRVLAMLSQHNGTAQHLSEKLCRRFVSDTPTPSLVQSAAKVWQDNVKHPQQIARVMRHILTSSEFKQALTDPAQRKLKRPLELAMSFVRKLDLPFMPTMGLVNELSNAGHRLYFWPTPDGHPDSNGYWLSSHTLRRRWTLPMGLIENWWATGFVGPDQLTAGFKQPFDESQLLKHHAQRLLGQAHATSTLSTINQALKTPDKRLLGAGNDEWLGMRRSLSYLGMSPAFQYR